jgi:hypothetical protein
VVNVLSRNTAERQVAMSNKNERSNICPIMSGMSTNQMQYESCKERACAWWDAVNDCCIIYFLRYLYER